VPDITIRQCAILVGGLGTRLGTLTATIPKPMLPIGGRPFLAWLMREFRRFGVEEFLLLTGHLSDQVEAKVQALADRLPGPVRIVTSEEPERAGTGGAVFHARTKLADRFLLCNGDSLFDFNLTRVLRDAADDEPGTIGRLVLRRIADASRYGVVALESDRVRAFHERPPPGAPGVINAGIYVFDRNLVAELTSACSLERDIMPLLAARGALRGTLAQGYFRDIGEPDDLARARAEMPVLLRRRALFLDRDGVLNVDHGHVGTRDRFEWMPGAKEAVGAATNAGWHVFVVTNQSGVARGHYTEADVRVLHAWMRREIQNEGGTIDDWRYCPFHPEGLVTAYRHPAHPWRKPAPGMLLDLIRTWELDAATSVLIGDQDKDLAAAAAAGVPARRFAGGNLLNVVLPLLQQSPA
jgi:D,D-heptose 1,7-bisphosphate phosphatase